MFVERIAKKLDKFGEQFTCDGNTYDGVFRILDTGTMHIYLDDIEAMGIIRPGLLLVTEPDADIQITDTITRAGRNYEVLKKSLHRISGTAVAMIVILA